MRLMSQLIQFESFRPFSYFLVWLACCGLVSLIVYTLVQWITANRLLHRLPVGKLIANLVCYYLIVNLFFVLTAHSAWAGVLGGTLLMLLATADYYVYRFKGTELSATDFFAIGTAKNVAGHYSYVPDGRVVTAWLIWVVCCIGQFLCFPSAARFPWLLRIVAVLLEGFLLVVFLVSTRHVRGTHWEDEGSHNYGYFLNFMLGLKSLLGLKPKSYDTERIIALEERLSKSEEIVSPRNPLPDIIVIMNESFADLSVLGQEPETNVPLLPVLRNLKENTIHGYALSSVFGGTTANSEYEFLTGNSMAFFPYGSIPYMQFIHGSSYSLVRELKQQGYQCMATHPYRASGWSRPTVYPAFGFDSVTFEEAYPKKDTPRGYISDSEMYDYMTRQYEKLSKDGNVFLFGVTVQNHGDYAGRSEMVENKVFLKNKPGKYPDVDQYLTLLERSDLALENLLSYFSNVERKVVLCFFGDHLPSLDPSYLKELHRGSFDTLDDREKTKMVPFFIWANYPINAQETTCTSLNYLSSRLLDVAGIPLSAYRLYLKDLETEIPAINADGYYSKALGHFQPISEAQGREAELLQDYRIMVYNNAIDKRHRSKLFSC